MPSPIESLGAWWRAASLRRLERHLPDGATLTPAGDILVTGDFCDVFDQLDRSYRFWRARAVCRRLVRPVRPSALRRDLRTAASTIGRARFGIGRQDAWDLHTYLSVVAARGLRTIADHGWGYPQNRPHEDVWHRELHAAADALDKWANDESLAGSDSALEGARQAWQWMTDNLEHLWD